MKILICAILAISIWAASPTSVTIYDTIRNPDGTLFSGELAITNGLMSCGGVTVPAQTRRLTITAGVLNTQLYATADCGTGQSYTIRYRSSDGTNQTAYWVIPASPTSTTVAAVQTTIAPVTSTTLLLTQLGMIGVSDGQCLRRSGSAWIGTACDAVSSVHGRTGAVTAQSGDYSAHYAALSHVHLVADITGLQTALDGKQATISGAPGTWPSFGGAALLDVGITPGTVAAGDDDRLANARAPTAHAASHQSGGSDVVVAATATALAANPANCAAGHYPLGVDATGAVEDCTADGGAGVANYAVTFSATTSVTTTGATHGLASANLVTACWDGSTPRNRVEGWQATVHPSTYDVVITFPAAFTGTCVLNVSGGGVGGGGGSGDVVGPSASVDSEVALFNSTTGKLIKRASATGVAKLTSGVLGVVTGTGTDCVLVNGSSGACGSGGSVTAGTGISVAGPVVSVDTAAVPSFLTGSATIDFTSISAGACQIQTFTLTGAVTGDSVIGGWPADMSTGIVPRILVSAANTVQIQLCNVTGGAIDPPSRTYGATIVRSF